MILNEGFISEVFGFSNVSANPGLKFRKASVCEALHFSSQLCNLALSTANVLCVVASSQRPTLYRALISSICDGCTNVLTVFSFRQNALIQCHSGNKDRQLLYLHKLSKSSVQEAYRPCCHKNLGHKISHLLSKDFSLPRKSSSLAASTKPKS